MRDDGKCPASGEPVLFDGGKQDQGEESDSMAVVVASHLSIGDDAAGQPGGGFQAVEVSLQRNGQKEKQGE